MRKTLYMLIGPKGSGKTHTGTPVNKNTDIEVFACVEPVWLAVKPGEDGWKKVENAIDAEFQNYDKVMVESLGAGEDFKRYCTSLKEKYTIKMIRLYADPNICLERVRNRNSAEHIPVSDDKVVEYNRIAAAVSYDWDAEINNNEFASDEDILKGIFRYKQKVLKQNTPAMSLILFDFDGVLADTLGDLLQFGQEACDELGVNHTATQDDLSSLEVMSFATYGQQLEVPDHLLMNLSAVAWQSLGRRGPRRIFSKDWMRW